MSINLVTYLRQLIKKIHYIIIIIIILSSLQFLYGKYRKQNSDLTLKINLYPIKVMYWSVLKNEVTHNIDNQLENLIYEIQDYIRSDEEYRSLLGTSCKVNQIILTCIKKSIPDEDLKNAKTFIKNIITHKFDQFFSKEFFFLEKKINRLEATLKRLKDEQKKLEGAYIEGGRYFMLEKNYLARLETETQIFDLYFIKESSQTVMDLLVLDDRNIEITKYKPFNNFLMTVLFGVFIGMLIIFFSMTEQKTED